jgi:hypothetical protein
MDQVLTAADFAPHLGKVFHAEGQPHVLTFATLNDRVRPDWPAAMRAPFSLILRGPPDAVLPEGSYRFTIEDGPSFELHIMPIHTPSREYQDYQVAFN